MVIQGVQDLYDIQEGLASDGADYSSKIVLIGKNLDKQKISDSFTNALNIKHVII